MTLCQNSKTKYFGRLFSVFALSFFLFGNVPNVKASEFFDETSLMTMDFTNNEINIESESNENLLLICFNNGYGIRSFSINNQASSVLLNETYGNISYIKNPKLGISSFTFSSYFQEINKCLLLNNVDTTQEFDVEKITSNEQLLITNITNSQQLVFFSPDIASYGGTNWVNFTDENVIKKYSDDKQTIFVIPPTEIENKIFSFIYKGGTLYQANQYLLDIKSISAPTSNDYVMYYGDNPSYTIRRKPFNFPVVYNVCDDYEKTGNYYRLRFNKDDNTYQDSAPIGTENNPCSGVYTFSEIAPDYEDSGTGYISIIDDIGGEIASTSPFLYTVYTPVGQTGAFIKPRFKSPVYADYFQATSTDLIFDYDVCMDDNFDTNSEICIDFVDTRSMGQLDYNKTDFCKKLSNCKGQVNIDFPIATGDMTAYFRASYYSGNLPDSQYVSSNPFLFTLYNSDAKDTANIFSKTSIHEMACSQEDWASDDWWDEIKCGTFETTLNGLNSIVNGLKLTINKTIRLFTNIFPFNFITKINECWEDSEFSSLPTELETINFLDKDGNVKIDLPSEWSESGTITFWGTDIFKANKTSTAFFDFIRNLSRYALWAMFIFGVYETAYDVYGEIMVAKINKRHDDSNYQL